MKFSLFLGSILFLLFFSNLTPQTKEPDWQRIEEETMRHFQALIRIDTSDPPGNEAPAVEYLKSVLEREGIETRTFALDPKRPNLVARISGTGRKRPVLIMGNTDVVNDDATKWNSTPFVDTRHRQYDYRRIRVNRKNHSLTWPTVY